MIQVKQCIFSPTQIIALFGTPAIALPAPPAGFVNNILGISHQTTYGTTPYTTATKMLYGSNDAHTVFEDDLVLGATVNYNLPSVKSQANQSIFSTTQALYVTTDHLAASGDTTINVYIIFEQIQIGA